MSKSPTFLSNDARALVIGASGGIGSAMTWALGNRLGMGNVVTGSRSADGLDIRNEASIVEFTNGLEGTFDLILCATGALEINGVGPEKSIKSLDPDQMRAQFETNALGPALLLKHLHPFLHKEGCPIYATLTARIGSIDDNKLGGWISYRAAKAAANQVVKTAAIELNRTNPNAICVALHPGTVQTDLTRKYASNYKTVTTEDACENLIRVMANLSRDDTGGFFDWQGTRIPW